MMRRACDLDPLSGYTSVMLGWVLHYAGKYDEALSQLDRAVELDPSLWVGHVTRGIALEEMGRLEEAVAEFRIAVDRSGNSGLARAHLACGLAREGDRACAIEIVNSLLKLRQKHYFSPYWIASIQASLNEYSKALQWLDIAIQERCGWMVFVGADPASAAYALILAFKECWVRSLPPTWSRAWPEIPEYPRTLGSEWTETALV